MTQLCPFVLRRRAVSGHFLGLFEELSRYSKDRIQTALHPQNIRAQHKDAVERQLKQLNEMMHFFDSDDRRKLTGHLDVVEKARLARAHRVFRVEIPLLARARMYAAKLPLLV